MSRIKKALERAKAERLNQGFMLAQPTLAEPESAEQMEVSVCYTRTRVVDVPSEQLINNKIVAIDEGNPANEQFKLLRTNLFKRTRLDRQNTVQVSGFGPGEGKSLVATNLAVSIAMDSRQTTLLADLDFRIPKVHELLGLPKDTPGLASYLLDGTPVDELMICPGIGKLSVLTAERPIPNCTELLGSHRMERLIHELKHRYDDRYIILDTPGINVCPDPLVIAEYVDAIILVARLGKTTKKNIKAAMERLPQEKVLGIVFNGSTPGELSTYLTPYPAVQQ